MMTSSDFCFLSKKLDSGEFSDKQISQTVYIIRCVAVLSVIAAHFNIVDNSNYLSSVITHVWRVFSSFGVPTFLIIGGYYYHRGKKDGKIFWQKKLHSVIIPWVIASFITWNLNLLFAHVWAVFFIIGASCIFNNCWLFLSQNKNDDKIFRKKKLYSVIVLLVMAFFITGSIFTIFKNSVSYIGYMKLFIGYGTLYYYMVIYISFLVVFKFIQKTSFLVALVIVMFVSLLGESLYFYGDYGGFYMMKYLNPLNWVGYFAFGILIKKYSLEKKVNNRVICVSSFAWLFLSLVECYLNELSYFSFFNPLVQTFFLFFVYGLVKCLLKTKFKQNLSWNTMLFVGQNSLIIYLYHNQILQIILNRLPKIWITQLINPFLGLVIMFLLVYVASYFLKPFSWGGA